MGIWKWMKGTDCSPLAGGKPDRRFRLPVFVLVCLLASGRLSAAPSLGFRIMPGYYVPVGNKLLLPGFGVSGSFDVFPVSNFGVFVDGEYVSIGHDNVESSRLTGGSLGASFLWSPAERWTIRADLMGGVYSAAYSDVSQSGISYGARLSGNYQFTPVVSAMAHAGFKQYAYRPDPYMNAVSVGLGVTINLTEAFSSAANIDVKTEKQEPVFPVFYSWYDDNGLATVRITNRETTTITDVKASFYLEQYMGQAKLCMTVKSLRPGESIEVPIKAFFNESMLELTEKIDAEAKILVEYRKLGTKKETAIPMTIPVYHRNAMSWEDDRRAAAFVSSKDPAALWFSKYVSSIVTGQFRNGINRNIQYAMGIFESLKTYGINYVIDPSSSYSDNAGSGASIDFLQYPYQTLMYRGGDCDDLSILYCSLFEAIGVESAFITIPGHIYVAFSTGLTEEEARKTFYAPEQLVYNEGVAWVPLEITLTKEGFNKAWLTGAKEWNDANRRGTAKLYPTKSSWEIYKPVSVPGASSRFTLPDEKATEVAFDAALNAFVERELRPQIRAYEAAIAKHDTPELRNRFGVLYGRYGMKESAKEQFAVGARMKNTDAWVNLGNVAFQNGNYPGALEYFNYVLSFEPDNSVALLGSARCYYELEKYRYSDALYGELSERDYPLSKKYTYLASFFDNTGRAWSLSDRLSTTTWSLSDGDLSPETIAAIEEELDDPVNAKDFIASLKHTNSATPNIDLIEGNASAAQTGKQADDLKVPEKETGTPAVPPATATGGLMAMLTIVRDEDDEAEARKESAELLKFKNVTPPDPLTPSASEEIFVPFVKPAASERKTATTQAEPAETPATPAVALPVPAPAPEPVVAPEPAPEPAVAEEAPFEVVAAAVEIAPVEVASAAIAETVAEPIVATAPELALATPIPEAAPVEVVESAPEPAPAIVAEVAPDVTAETVTEPAIGAAPDEVAEAAPESALAVAEETPVAASVEIVPVEIALAVIAETVTEPIVAAAPVEVVKAAPAEIAQSAPEPAPSVVAEVAAAEPLDVEPAAVPAAIITESEPEEKTNRSGTVIAIVAGVMSAATIALSIRARGKRKNAGGTKKS